MAETVVIEGLLVTVDDVEYKAFVSGLVQKIRQPPVVESASTYYETNDPGLVARRRADGGAPALRSA